MLHIQQFQHNRQDYLRHYQRLRLLGDENFSICSNQYAKKFSQISRPLTTNDAYARSQTLFFLSEIPPLDTKATNWNQQQTRITRENKDYTTPLTKGNIRDDDKQISNENFSSRSHHQIPNSIYRHIKSVSKGSPLSTSISERDKIPFPIVIESHQSTTTPIILEERIRRTVSARVTSTTPTRSSPPLRTPRLIDSSDNFDNFTNSSFFHLPDELKATVFKDDNQLYTDTNMNDALNSSSRDDCLDSSPGNNSPDERTTNEMKILQCKMNGLQHIVNLGSWQRNSRNNRRKSSDNSKEIECEDEYQKDTDQSSFNLSKSIYEYKNPFSEEYVHAISIQPQLQMNNNNQEWNLRDFYRDVKTDFDPETNTKDVFEKCIKLARLQANTIKWEQRRRQNMNLYNRLLKNPGLDINILTLNGSFPPKATTHERDIHELKRELRCSDCKRISCLGNCAPGQEYHQYKRIVPFSSSISNTRDQIRSKLGYRTQRTTTDLRPRSTQPVTRETKYKFQQTNLNPVVVVPLFEDESQTKRPQKKLTNGFLPGKSFRSQRRDPLTLISSQNITS